MEGWASVAVIVLTPPFSVMRAGDADSVSAMASSSTMTRFTPPLLVVTPVVPGGNVADTATVLSPSRFALFTAAIVTVPVLSYELAAMLSVVPDCVISPATPGDCTAAATVTAVAVVLGCDSCAVIVLTPPFSSIGFADAASRTSMSSLSVRAIVGAPATTSRTLATVGAPTPATVILMDSSRLSTVLSVGVMVKAPLALLAPDAMLKAVELCVNATAVVPAALGLTLPVAASCTPCAAG